MCHTRCFHVNPMTGKFEAWYVPRDVAGQHLVVWVVRIAVRKVHGNLWRVRRQIECRPHAPVDLHFFGTRIVLDHIPRALNLKKTDFVWFILPVLIFIARIFT